MSKSRPLLSRPRTKVYESNYNAGQSYYKSTLDNLDRKYGRTLSSEPATNGAIGGLRASLDRERERERVELPSPRTAIRDLEDDEFFADLPKTRKTTALLGEFDSIFESRVKNGIQKERTPPRQLKQSAFDDEIEEDLAASMKRLRASRAARAAEADLDEIESNLSSRKSNLRSKLDFSDKLIDSVGLSGKSRAALEEEGITGKRRVLKITATSSSEQGNENDQLTRWTSLKSGTGRRHVLDDEEESSAQIAAAARAKKSRARLDDLEAEMQALAERGAAREKRVRDLKALVQENEANSKETLHSAVRVKSSIQSEKKVVSF